MKQEFKNDLEKNLPLKEEFDHKKLPPLKTRKRMKTPYKILIISGSILTGVILTLAPFAIILGANGFFDGTTSVKTYSKKYSVNQIKIAENNSFIKLNDVAYPENTLPEKYQFSEDEINAYNNFCYNFYKNTLDKKDNFSLGMINSYSIMNELFGAVSSNTTKEKFDEILGLNMEERTNFYQHMMNANSYAVDDCTTQLKNSAFFTNEHKINPDYISLLNNIYCEAYQLDIHQEVNKMVSWANQALNDSNYINKDFFEIDEETVLVYMSTLYFKNMWNDKYLESNNFIDDFYLSNGETLKTTYMKHSYFIDHYYDYGDYISFSDYYLNKRCSITYIVPKSNKDNIYDLTKTANIFKDNEENIIENIKTYGDYQEKDLINVKLTTPKIKLDYQINLKDTLCQLGLEDIFNRDIDTFRNAFIDAPSNHNFYLQKIKQKNQTEFNEDGTIVKSLAVAMGGESKSSNPFEMDTLEVNLNQPFIYIIKDVNDMPIYVGHVDHPKY